MTEDEFEVWYDAHDGARRHLKALTLDGVEHILSDLKADDHKKQLLAMMFGLQTRPHEYNVSVVKRTTTLEPVDLD